MAICGSSHGASQPFPAGPKTVLFQARKPPAERLSEPRQSRVQTRESSPSTTLLVHLCRACPLVTTWGRLVNGSVAQTLRHFGETKEVAGPLHTVLRVTFLFLLTHLLLLATLPRPQLP